MIKKSSLATLLVFIIACAALGQKIRNTETSPESIAPKTSIEWQMETFEFGEIIEGEKIRNVFTFTNTGSNPLIISSAKGSCGCTVPMWPKEPIAPGESADLLVQFDSKGKGRFDGIIQSKRVTITANTDQTLHYLTIRGKVFRDAEKIKGKKAEKTETESANQTLNLESEKVLLYPNPTNDELKVNLNYYANISGSIDIYDSNGKKIEGKNVADFGIEQVFNVQNYIPGLYTVSIKVSGKNRIAKRFLVPEYE